MRTTRRSSTLAAAAALCLAGIATGQSNIDPAASLAWSENLGWIEFYPSAQYGVVVTATHLEGYAWSENAGWIWFGDGPDNGVAYTNTGTDHGVNNDGDGTLSGYAWGENIGWIVFDTETGGGGSVVTIDMTTGQFGGFAWAENAGWINFDQSGGVRFNPNTASVADWALLE